MYKLLNMADFCSNEELEKDMDYVKDVLNEGSKKARAIAIEKIKKDLKKYDCPLMELEKGGKGRGNIKKFIKKSAELYKDWVRK